MAVFSPVNMMMDSLKAKIAGSSFSSTLSNRVAVDRLEADVALPCCVYSMKQFDINRFMGNQEKYDGLVEFTIFDTAKTGTAGLHTLSGLLEAAMTTGTFTISNMDRLVVTRVSGGAPSFQDDSWSIIERYRMSSFKL
jgi:hypothetical protein